MAEESVAIMMNLRRAPVERSRSDDLSAVGCANGLVAQADPKDGHSIAQLTNEIHADAGAFRVARTW